MKKETGDRNSTLQLFSRDVGGEMNADVSTLSPGGGETFEVALIGVPVSARCGALASERE